MSWIISVDKSYTKNDYIIEIILSWGSIMGDSVIDDKLC